LSSNALDDTRTHSLATPSFIGTGNKAAIWPSTYPRSSAASSQRSSASGNGRHKAPREGGKLAGQTFRLAMATFGKHCAEKEA